MKQSDIQWFIDTVQNTPIAYNEPLKSRWARVGTAIMRELAKRLGYSTNQRKVEFNQGGIAVSGEIWLFADDLFVQFSQGSTIELGILYRKGIVKDGRRDSCGGPNRWLKWEALLDMEKAAETIGKVRQES